MKRLHIAMIGLVGAVMVFLCVILGRLLTQSVPSGAARGNYGLVQEKKFRAGDIRSLEIDYGKGSAGITDVLFYESPGDEIIVREYMNYEPEQSQLSAVEQSDGELTIRGRGRSWFSFFSVGFRGAYTEVYLPAALARDMEALTVKTVSGDISSEIGLKIRDGFAVSTTSGDILFSEVQAGKIQASSTSGDMQLDSAAAETLNLSTVSGDMALKQACGKMKMSSTSGEIRLSGLEGPLRASTTSGAIRLGQMAGDVSLSTTSGAIALGEVRGDFDAESTSGDIRVESLEGSFRMNTASGELSVSTASGFGTAHSVSGDISIFLAALAGDLDISTTSGTVDLAFPETADFRFGFSTVSGECQTFFDNALSFDKKRRNAEGQYGEGTHSVGLSTTSGDLSVRKF